MTIIVLFPLLMTEFVPYAEHHLEIYHFCLERGLGRKIFLAKWKLLSPPADTFQNRFVCVYAHTHDVYSDFGGADDTAKAEMLPKSDRVTVLIFHSEDCLSY